MARYRILSLDGGGVRGALTARLLARIEAETPGFLAGVHLFAGTSTGSILAVGLAKGVTPLELVTLYQDQSAALFNDTLFHDVGGLWGLVGAKYTTQNRYTAIHPTIGDITLNDLLPLKVLVSSFQLDSANPITPAASSPHSWKAKFFHNFPGADSDGPQKAIEVIMRSSAAPTYFPIYQGFIDGGVVANNPSMCALSQAINVETGGQKLEDISLLSLGTGTRPQYITSKDGNWGLKQWGFTLLDLLFDSGVGLADYQCQQLLGSCYLRLNPDLDHAIGLDAVNSISALISVADNVELGPCLRWIEEYW